MQHRRWGAALLVAVALMVAPAVAGAVPIAYEDVLFNGFLVFGTNTQAPANQNNPVGANYYQFFATAGSNVTVSGARLDSFYDMSFWVFSGLFADTDDFGGGFDFGDAAFADFADDEIPHPGPFGDPQSMFVAPSTGWYTVAVTNFFSGAGGPPNDFVLTAAGVENVPEPGTLLLLGSGITGLALRRRRRS